MVELVDTTDLKSVAFREGRAGSIPAPGTTITYWAFSSIGQSSGLIIRWFGVRVPEGPPNLPVAQQDRA